MMDEKKEIMTDNNSSIPSTSSAPGFDQQTAPTPEPVDPVLEGGPIEIGASGEVTGTAAELPRIDLNTVTPGGMPTGGSSNQNP